MKEYQINPEERDMYQLNLYWDRQVHISLLLALIQTKIQFYTHASFLT